MSIGKQTDKIELPCKYEELLKLMPPRAITDGVHYENTIEMIDRLMAGGKLSKDQAVYMETLVQLVEAYEAEHYRIETSDIHGIDSLKHLLEENGMNASDLAKLLGVHVSMGSKILKGERSLTIGHVKKLAGRFKVNPGLFID